MPNKILNTNMGLGFQRGRKYDTDLDRLGRMETSHGELRKTRELNLRTEMKKLKKSMNMYSTRRFSVYPHKVMMTESQLAMFSEALQREFGMGDAISNTVGGIVDTARDVTGSTVEAAGKTVSAVGKPVAGLAGGIGGTVLGGLGGGLVLGPLGALAGAVGGGMLGGKAASGIVGGVGDAVKGMGQSIHT